MSSCTFFFGSESEISNDKWEVFLTHWMKAGRIAMSSTAAEAWCLVGSYQPETLLPDGYILVSYCKHESPGLNLRNKSKASTTFMDFSIRRYGNCQKSDSRSITSSDSIIIFFGFKWKTLYDSEWSESIESSESVRSMAPSIVHDSNYEMRTRFF